MYTDDAAYQNVAAQYRNGTPKPIDKPLQRYARRTPLEIVQTKDEPLISTILAHAWHCGMDFSYFDIGCQYGSSAMSTAQLILSNGFHNHIYAFDPGVGSELAPYTIALNRLEERITFERLAVAQGDFPTIVFTELGHSENNRVVNRTPPDEATSYVVMATSIDNYIARHQIITDLIVKIDTQGGEVEVFQGMERTIADRTVLCFTEFAPDAIGTRANPVEWLTERVQQGFTLFDIGDNNMFHTRSHRLRPVVPHAVPDFVQAVSRRPSPYTDLLLVPNRFPGYQTLIASLTHP